ncbi:ABC transporter permease [Ruminococcaceae bacterium OttesenSCG-928-D13]|nr:ABC transporter permease [Ruminococcaceae bacterium OttesenSCG-928-D13]
MRVKRKKGVAVPYLAWMIIFTALPLVLVIFFAFTNKDGGFTLDNLTGLGNYVSVFFLSLILAAIATVLCLVIAYPISFMLSRLRAGRQGILLMLVMLPMWMNFLLRTYAWMSLLEYNGLINRFLGIFGIGPFEMINTAGAVVLGMVYNYLPYMILPLYTAMVKISPSVIEAAEDLGAGFWSKLFRVILPLSKPGIQTGITMVFVPAISTFIISKMLSGGNIWLIGDLIESQFLGNAYNYNLGSAMSLVLMVVVLLIMSLTGGFDQEDIEGVI